jgi:hypothetical protein
MITDPPAAAYAVVTVVILIIETAKTRKAMICELLIVPSNFQLLKEPIVFNCFGIPCYQSKERTATKKAQRNLNVIEYRKQSLHEQTPSESSNPNFYTYRTDRLDIPTIDKVQPALAAACSYWGSAPPPRNRLF